MPNLEELENELDRQLRAFEALAEACADVAATELCIGDDFDAQLGEMLARVERRRAPAVVSFAIRG